MIYVSDDRARQVEYLIQQSAQGNHVLFDAETLRRIFRRNGAPDEASFSAEDAYAVEHHVEKLISEPSLEIKRAYLEALPPATFEQVVRTYFSIIENCIYENAKEMH